MTSDSDMQEPLGIPSFSSMGSSKLGWVSMPWPPLGVALRDGVSWTQPGYVCGQQEQSTSLPALSTSGDMT
jgi:hypothetical protein